MQSRGEKRNAQACWPTLTQSPGTGQAAGYLGACNRHILRHSSAKLMCELGWGVSMCCAGRRAGLLDLKQAQEWVVTTKLGASDKRPGTQVRRCCPPRVLASGMRARAPPLTVAVHALSHVCMSAVIQRFGDCPAP